MCFADRLTAIDTSGMDRLCLKSTMGILFQLINICDGSCSKDLKYVNRGHFPKRKRVTKEILVVLTCTSRIFVFSIGFPTLGVLHLRFARVRTLPRKCVNRGHHPKSKPVVTK